MRSIDIGNPDEIADIINARTPRDYFKFEDDFTELSVDTTADHSRWNSTITGSGTITLPDTTDGSMEQIGGLVMLHPDTTDSDLAVMNTCSEMFQIKAGYPLFFSVRAMIDDVSQIGAYLGLSATITNGAVENAKSPMIGFKITAGSTATVTFVTINATSNKTTDSTVTLADGNWFRLAFYFDGDDTITAWIAKDTVADAEWVQICSRQLSVTTDYIPQELGMGVTLEAEGTGPAASGDDLYVEYVETMQKKCFYE